ncbi:MAG: family transporter protein [Thermoleophilia bacterium]|nr:family transporter protein [Thermoleophilia bacterium]
MRDELRRQLTRRRTRVVLLAMVVIPLALAAIYAVRGTPELAPGASPQLVHLAAGSALAFGIFVLYLCAPLLLLAVAATFAGDALAAEAGWGSLRYLLAAPVPRRRLLARKLLAAVVLTAAALLVLVGTSLLAGLVAFGWHALDTPVGGELAASVGAERLAIACAYVLVSVMPFMAIALLCATATDAPLAAVGAAVGVAVVSQILDEVPTLGVVRSLLPTHYAYAWTDLFVDPPLPDQLAAGTLQAACYAVAACAAAWWSFSRRDITA